MGFFKLFALFSVCMLALPQTASACDRLRFSSGSTSDCVEKVTLLNATFVDSAGHQQVGNLRVYATSGSDAPGCSFLLVLGIALVSGALMLQGVW